MPVKLLKDLVRLRKFPISLNGKHSPCPHPHPHTVLRTQTQAQPKGIARHAVACIWENKENSTLFCSRQSETLLCPWVFAQFSHLPQYWY